MNFVTQEIPLSKRTPETFMEFGRWRKTQDQWDGWQNSRAGQARNKPRLEETGLMGEDLWVGFSSLVRFV